MPKNHQETSFLFHSLFAIIYSMKSVNQHLSFFDRLIVFLIKSFPNHAYTRLVYKLSRIEKPIWFKNILLKTLVQIYQIDLSIAEKTEVTEYKNFSELFIRKLKSKAREIDTKPDSIVSPVDGEIAAMGLIMKNTIIQAKSINYSTKKLLKDPEIAKRYQDGFFITLYLAPSNYHRVHFPASVQVESMNSIPGSLFSVNKFTQQKVEDLFANQERLVINLKTNFVDDKLQNPNMALVMVGAIGVGSINTSWQGQITPPYGSKKSFYYPFGKIMNFEKGEELGYFNLGSTVILFFPKNTIRLEGGLKEGAKIKMGQVLARFSSQSDDELKSKYELSKETKLRDIKQAEQNNKLDDISDEEFIKTLKTKTIK